MVKTTSGEKLRQEGAQKNRNKPTNPNTTRHTQQAANTSCAITERTRELFIDVLSPGAHFRALSHVRTHVPWETKDILQEAIPSAQGGRKPMCPCRTSCKRGSWVFLGNAFQSASRSRQSTFWCGKSQKYSRRGHGRSPGALCRAHEEENVSASAPRRQRDPCGDHGYSRGAHFRWHRQTDRGCPS